MEPSAVAARRTRASLALAVAGAVVLMAGVALALAGEGLRLEPGAHPPSLIGPGLVLAFLGLVLGASAIVTIVLDAPTRLPATHPLAAARPAGPPAFGPPPAVGVVPGYRPAFGSPSAAGVVPGDRPAFGSPPAGRPGSGPPPPGPAAHGAVVAGEVLSSSRLPDPRPLAAPARTEVVPGAPLLPPRGADLGYSDAGWGASAGGPAWRDSPPEPPPEIHHPGRR